MSSSDNQCIALNCHPPESDSALDTKALEIFTGQFRDEETRLGYFGAR